MKKLRFIICVIVGLSFFSCNEDEWLEEKPYTFRAPGDSYETTTDFKQAVNFMYEMLRYWHFRYQDEASGMQQYLYIGGDLFYHGWPNQLDHFLNRYDTYIVSNNNLVYQDWSFNYQVIAKANDVLTMLETNASKVSEADKVTFRAEALFFRGFYYRKLAHVWGGVPIITEMLTSPKIDATRATREEVYEQARQDLEEAVRALNNIDEVKDGALNKQLAQHVLAEVYMSQGNYTKAIELCNAVINHPRMALMTERYGDYKDDNTKDVFYDLFRHNNAQRSKGNTEALYVLQYDYQNGSPNIRNLSRYIMPQVRTALIPKSRGSSETVSAAVDFTDEWGGRGNGYWTTTHHFRKTVWGADFDNDIRNSEYNIYRDYPVDNINAEGHGQWIVKDGWLRDQDTFNFVYPAVTKFCAFDNYPANAYQLNPDGTRKLTALGYHMLIAGDGAITSNKDEYLYRLAETYLLLAEGYVRNSQPQLAADAVNVVRNRANATPATAAEMDIDYILDERIRELCGEEPRNITLFRMGEFVRRAQKYNPTRAYIGNWQNLWPIPYGEIEKNIGAELTQNPGYASTN